MSKTKTAILMLVLAAFVVASGCVPEPEKDKPVMQCKPGKPPFLFRCD